MTIYVVFHWIYSLTHIQCFLQSISNEFPSEWLPCILVFLVVELSGHLAICTINWSLKKFDSQPPAEPPAPDTSELEAEMRRYTATLQKASGLLEARIPLLEQENRELEAEVQAMQEAAFRRMNSDL